MAIAYKNGLPKSVKKLRSWGEVGCLLVAGDSEGSVEGGVETSWTVVNKLVTRKQEKHCK